MNLAGLHSLLRRQLKRCFGPEARVPAGCEALLAAVNDAYRASDEDRLMLERSLELSSQELLQASADTRAVYQALPDLVIRLDAERRVLECRAGATEHSTGPVRIERTPTDMAAPHLGPAFLAAAVRATATGRMATAEYAVAESGGERNFEARVVPAREGQLVAFIRDITARTRAEQDLFRSRETLRKILDTAPQRIFWKDRHSVFLGCNRRLAEDAGYADPNDLIGKDDTGTASAEMAAHYQADDRLVMESDRPKLDFEEPQMRPDGSRRWLRTSKVPLHGPDGRVIGILGTYEDITERKRAEVVRAGQSRILEMIVTGSPLRDTLDELARLVEVQAENMFCSILVADPDLKRLRSFSGPNLPAGIAQAADGIPVGEGFGSCGTAAARKQPVIVTDVDRDPLWERFRSEAIEFGIRACWSMPILSSHDTLLGTFAMYFSTPRHPTPADRELLNMASHLAGIALERQHTEDELRRTLSLVQSTLESTGDGILVVDREGHIVSHNARFVTLWEIPAAVLASRVDAEALAHMGSQINDPAGFVQRVRQLYDDPDGEGFDVLALKDGRVFERYSSPQRLDGRPIGRVWNFRDVTQRVRLEEQFRQAQKMEAIGQLAGGVAHDFNNLLTVIIGNLSVIRMGRLDPHRQDIALEDCFRSAKRAALLTGQLLTFSRRQAVELKELDLNEVVADLASMLRRLIGEHIVLDTALAPNAAPVRADRSMMEQLVMNLAVNSRDAMPHGGKLEITTAVVALGPEAVRGARVPGPFVRLTVSDNGTGITPEHRERLFEPFFTTKEVGKGTGLGLATVFGIVEQHNGWIDVESHLGAGTAMHVFLPCSQGPATTPARRALAPVPRGGRETILLVEDEQEVRTLMRRLLEQHGYKVHPAHNAAEALRVWSVHRPEIELLVTDMVMPGGMGGRELADRVKAENPSLPVIYCSGYTDEMLGGDLPLRRSPNFLEKPFDVHVFLHRVRACLDAARGPRAQP